MDLDILDRYDSRNDNLRHAAVLWAGGAVTPRTAVADLPEARLPMRIEATKLPSVWNTSRHEAVLAWINSPGSSRCPPTSRLPSP